MGSILLEEEVITLNLPCLVFTLLISLSLQTTIERIPMISMDTFVHIADLSTSLKPSVTFSSDTPKRYVWWRDEVTRWCEIKPTDTSTKTRKSNEHAQEDDIPYHFLSFHGLPENPENTVGVQMDSTLRIINLRVDDKSIRGLARIQGGMSKIDQLLVGCAIDRQVISAKNPATIVDVESTLSTSSFYEFRIPFDEAFADTVISSTSQEKTKPELTLHQLTFRVYCVFSGESEEILLDDGEDDDSALARGFHIRFVMATVYAGREARLTTLRDLIAELRVAAEVRDPEDLSNNEDNDDIDGDDASVSTNTATGPVKAGLSVSRPILPPVTPSLLPLSATNGKSYWPGRGIHPMSQPPAKPTPRFRNRAMSDGLLLPLSKTGQRTERVSCSLRTGKSVIGMSQKGCGDMGRLTKRKYGSVNKMTPI